MKIENKILFISFSILILWVTFTFGNDLSPWSGKVVGVTDGDTITVMREGHGVKIRLAEIDCPEDHQSFGTKAKRFTSDLCFGKIVMIKPSTIDRYGRIVAHIILPDSHDLSEDLLVAGLAWQYKQYSDSPKLAELEAEARTARLGIWSYPNSVPPWEWRRTNREAHDQTQVQTPITQSGELHGNISSRVFHSSNCRYFHCKNCIVVFKNREEAVKAGYRPCKICNP